MTIHQRLLLIRTELDELAVIANYLDNEHERVMINARLKRVRDSVRDAITESDAELQGYDC